jgi:hypothetical protein
VTRWNSDTDFEGQRQSITTCKQKQRSGLVLGFAHPELLVHRRVRSTRTASACQRHRRGKLSFDVVAGPALNADAATKTVEVVGIR